MSQPYAFLAKPWVPTEKSERAAWTLADCDCEPEVRHCTRCDGRRLMLAVAARLSEGDEA